MSAPEPPCFVLVHGAWHDARAWDQLREIFDARGCRSIAADLPIAQFPSVPTSYILMRDDRMIRPQWSRIAAPRRLGVEPIELPGGHSPMLANPKHLADILIQLTR